MQGVDLMNMTGDMMNFFRNSNALLSIPEGLPTPRLLHAGDANLQFNQTVFQRSLSSGMQQNDGKFNAEQTGTFF